MHSRKSTIAIALLVIVVTTTTIVAYRSRRSEPAGGGQTPNVPAATSREASPPRADDILAKLQPGMLRVDVEAILGPPSSVESVRSANGKLIYRATFTRDRARPPLPPLILEFDASQTGHPLLIAKVP